jgi:uncharacterized Zn finger protein
MLHSITVEGLSPRISVRCDECGTLALASTDRSADIAISQHDARWTV